MTPTSVLVFQHFSGSPPGLIAEEAAVRGIRLHILDAEASCAIPPDAMDHDGLLLLGGVMGAHDDHLAAHFPELLALARAFAAADKPVLGICLGGQLLAKAFGGAVHSQRHAEFGFLPIQPTAAAMDDLLLSGIEPGVTLMQWHDDSFDLPPDAVPLLQGSPCRWQAFRVGRSAWGFQCHFEVTHEIATSWAQTRAIWNDEPDAPAIVAEQMKKGWATTEAVGRRLAGRWLELCTPDSSGFRVTGDEEGKAIGAEPTDVGEHRSTAA